MIERLVREEAEGAEAIVERHHDDAELRRERVAVVERVAEAGAEASLEELADSTANIFNITCSFRCPGI